MRTSIEELQDRFQKHLDFKITLKNPYKLCDFRPLYGLAFQDELEGYDFWGHCDIDLIWGDIRSFITDNILREYDRVGQFGHFTIYRNTEKNNNLFKLSGGVINFKEVFMNSESYAFDETTGMNLICKKNKIDFYEIKNIADISPSYSRIRLHANDYSNELFYWIDGRCYRTYIDNDELFTEQYMYIHFQKKKLHNFIDIPECVDSFRMKKDGFYHTEFRMPYIEDIISEIDYRGEKFEKNERYKYNVKKLKMLMKKSIKEMRIWIKIQIAIKRYNRI